MKVTGADQYTVWNTDSSGNYLGNAFGYVPGATLALEALEPSFKQDLNGDGVVGIPLGAGAAALAPPSSGSIVGTADFSGDGQPDILWLGAGNTPMISEMNGSSVISTAVLPAPPPSWRLVGTGDVNGDGKSDILWQNSDGEVSVWEMNGTNILSALSVGNPGAAWRLQGASDVNGDGKSDLLFLNPSTTQSQTWLMNGTQVTSMQSSPVLSETEFYIPAELAGGAPASTDAQTMAMAGEKGPIGQFPLPDGGATGPVFPRN
jgi:hypothetical protein